MPPRGFHKIRCSHGHLFTEANVLLIGGERRSCLQCRRAYDADRRSSSDEARRAKSDYREAVLDALSEVQLAYLGGLIDGEGCIYAGFRLAAGRHGPNVALVLKIQMGTAEPLATIADWLGGLERPIQEAAAPKPGHRRRWNWRLHGRAAAALLRRVRPYLLLKGEQADLAIQMDATREAYGRGQHGRGIKLPSDLLGELASASDRMHALNQRGVDKEVA